MGFNVIIEKRFMQKRTFTPTRKKKRRRTTTTRERKKIKRKKRKKRKERKMLTHPNVLGIVLGQKGP